MQAGRPEAEPLSHGIRHLDRTFRGWWEGCGNPKLPLAIIWSPGRATVTKAEPHGHVLPAVKVGGMLRAQGALENGERWGSRQVQSSQIGEGRLERVPLRASRECDAGRRSPVRRASLPPLHRPQTAPSRSVPGRVSPRAADGVSGWRETCAWACVPQGRTGSRPHWGPRTRSKGHGSLASRSCPSINSENKSQTLRTPA